MAKKKGELGIGLDALFDDNFSEVQTKKTLRIADIEPNRSQPRKDFDDTSIQELAQSIRDFGIIQPLLVRPLEDGTYQIVAGERRWRASRMAGLDEVPVYIRDISEQEAMQLALIENLQRENLNPIEEAMGYRDLIDTYDMNQEQVANTVGKSRPYITNALRILNMPEEIQEMLKDGSITVGHAKVLGSIDNVELMVALAKKVKEKSLSVRALEEICKQNDDRKIKREVNIDSYYKEMELSLNDRLARKVKVDFRKNKGVLQLEFYDKDDLAAIAELLTLKSL